jgi:hypothetical protein
MIMMDEDHALEQVRSRLVERFPHVPVETVHLTVQDIHNRFDGRVRDYVPILVEREARARLAVLAADAHTQTAT